VELADRAGGIERDRGAGNQQQQGTGQTS